MANCSLHCLRTIERTIEFLLDQSDSFQKIDKRWNLIGWTKTVCWCENCPSPGNVFAPLPKKTCFFSPHPRKIIFAQPRKNKFLFLVESSKNNFLKKMWFFYDAPPLPTLLILKRDYTTNNAHVLSLFRELNRSDLLYSIPRWAGVFGDALVYKRSAFMCSLSKLRGCMCHDFLYIVSSTWIGLSKFHIQCHL